MHVFAYTRGLVIEALRDLGAAGRLCEGLDFSAVRIEVPRDQGFGHISCNAALALAGAASCAPRDLASALADRLILNTHVQNVHIAGPGFLNIELSTALWCDVLEGIRAQGVAYGSDFTQQTAELAAQQTRAKLICWAFADASQDTVQLSSLSALSGLRGIVTGQALGNLLRWGGHEVQFCASGNWPHDLAALCPLTLHVTGAQTPDYTFLCGDPTQTKAHERTQKTRALARRCLPPNIQGHDADSAQDEAALCENDALRYGLVARRCDLALTLFSAQLDEASYDNPLYAIQYAYARAARLQDAQVQDEATIDKNDHSFDAPQSLRILALLASWPEVAKLAADLGEPNRIATFLNTLALAFHSLCDPTLLRDGAQGRRVQSAKIALSGAVAVVLRAGLGILGLEPAEEMR